MIHHVRGEYEIGEREAERQTNESGQIAKEYLARLLLFGRIIVCGVEKIIAKADALALRIDVCNPREDPVEKRLAVGHPSRNSVGEAIQDAGCAQQVNRWIEQKHAGE